MRMTVVRIAGHPFVLDTSGREAGKRTTRGGGLAQAKSITEAELNHNASFEREEREGVVVLLLSNRASEERVPEIVSARRPYSTVRSSFTAQLSVQRQIK